MKVNPLLKSVNPDSFIHDYLHACGISDVDSYLHPSIGCLDYPREYMNMVRAVNRLHEAIKNDEVVALIVD